MMDEKEKRHLSELGFNIVQFGPDKIAIGEWRTGAVLRDHIPLTYEILKWENWGIAHSRDMKRYIVIIDIDATDKPIPSEVIPFLFFVKEYSDKVKSYRGFVEFENRADAELLVQEFHNNGIELYLENHKVAICGEYILNEKKCNQYNIPKGTKKWCRMKDGIKIPIVKREEFIKVLESFGINRGGTQPQYDISKDIVENRVTTLYRITWQLYGYGHTNTIKETREKIIEINQTKCKPPLEGKEWTEDFLKRQFCNAIEFARKIRKTNQSEHDHKTKIKRMEIINEILKEYDFTRIQGDKDRKLYLKKNRVYKEHGDDDLADIITEKWTDRSTEDRNYIITYIKDKRYTHPSDFDKDHYILNLKNCYFSILKFIRGENPIVDLPDYKSLIQLNLEYHPNIPIFIAFKKLLEEILPQDADLMAERMCSILCRSLVNPEKVYWDNGDGQNGKSTIYHIIESLFGKDAISSIKPHEISDDLYASIELENKFAVICHDISEAKIRDMTVFKSLATRDVISGQHKYGHRRDFTPHAVVILGNNALPDIDLTYSIARRSHVTLFEQVFDGSKDEHWKTFVDTEEKKSGIFNFLLGFLPGILERNGKLSRPQSPEKTMSIWNNKINSVEIFLETMIERDKTDKKFISKSDMLEKYTEWCKVTVNPENNEVFTPVSSGEFSRMLTAHGYTYKRKRIGTENTYYWVDVKVRENGNLKLTKE